MLSATAAKFESLRRGVVVVCAQCQQRLTLYLMQDNAVNLRSMAFGPELYCWTCAAATYAPCTTCHHYTPTLREAVEPGTFHRCKFCANAATLAITTERFFVAVMVSMFPLMVRSGPLFTRRRSCPAPRSKARIFF